jgi:Putative glycerate kinase
MRSSMIRSSPRCFITAIAATQAAAISLHHPIICNQPSVIGYSRCQYKTKTTSSILPIVRLRSHYSSARFLSSHSKASYEQTQMEQKMTNDALSMIDSAIAAVNPSKAVESHLSLSGSILSLLDRSTGTYSAYDLENYDRIYVAAFGKAAASMALATARILSSSCRDKSNNLSVNISGKVITKDDHASQEVIQELRGHNIHLYFASHPVPDERSIQHSRELIADLTDLDEKTLVINCISGGGSALFCTPLEPLDLSNMSSLNQCLLSSGMPIQEMNILRKKLEIGKGGGLVEMAHPATCITMVLSDVIGDPLDLIASGPSVRDTSTYEEANALVEKYNLGRGAKYELPLPVLETLETHNHNGKVFHANHEENELDVFEKSTTVLVGNNGLAVSSAARQAKDLGYNPVVLGTTIEGEAMHIANMYVSMAKEIQLQRTNPSLSHFPLAPLPAALISGGETTVTLSNNHGKGGRNQEIGLAAALKLKSHELRDIVVASVGTDGTDGPTDAAGAIVDGGTVDRLERGNGWTYSGEEALRKHDAYNFLQSSSLDESLIRTGATGTNVADVCVILIQ